MRQAAQQQRFCGYPAGAHGRGAAGSRAGPIHSGAMQDPFDAALVLPSPAPHSATKGSDALSVHPLPGIQPATVVCGITAAPSQEGGGAGEEVGGCLVVQDPIDAAIALSPRLSGRAAQAPDPSVLPPREIGRGRRRGSSLDEAGGPSRSGAGELGDAAKEVGCVGMALVGPQVLEGCSQALVGTSGFEAGVGVEEGVPVGEGGIEVAES